MKIYSLTLILIMAASTAFSQTFDWVTNDTIETNLAQNTTVLLKMEQQAIGTDTVTLGIEVIYNDLPSYWDGMICIEGLCLGTIAVTGTTAQMTPISGTESGYVRLTVNPLGGTEVAKLQVYVFDVNYPNDGDTATWLLNTTLGVDEIGFDVRPELFPNPVSETINFSSKNKLDHIEIYNLSGTISETFNFKAQYSGSIDLVKFPSGMYFIKYTDETGKVAMDKFIKK